MVAALPHCDALVSGHSFAALAEVADAIGGAEVLRRPRRRPKEGAGAVGERDAGARAARSPCRAASGRPREHDAGVVPSWPIRTCIYPGCGRPAVPPHPLGGPQPAFCDLEEHNALTAHQERQRLEREEGERTSG